MNGIEALSASPVGEATARALVHFLWQGALVGIAAGGILTLLERSRASVRYAVAAGALFLMAALPFITAFRLVETAGVDFSDVDFSDVIAEGLVFSQAEAGPAPSPVSLKPASRTFGASLLPWFFGAWLAGVAVLSLYNLAGWRWVRRLPRNGEPAGEAVASLVQDLCRRLRIRRAVALLKSSAVSVPTVVGWLRPVILVPASTLTGLSPRQLEAILAHELAHIRRHDYLINLLQTTVETLLFYHPAVWWVSAQVRRERESCCDDLAVAVCGDRLSYARALVNLEGLRSSAPRLALAASDGSLTDRVQRLVGAPGRRSRRPWAAGLLALALLPAGAAVQLACGKPVAKEVRSNPEIGRRGTWKAEIQGDKLRLEMTFRKIGWGRWTSVDEYPVSQLTGFAPNSESRFELRRGAGTFHFQGAFEGKHGRGTCGFKADPEFEKALGQRLSIDRAMEIAVYDLSLEYIREMKALGLTETEPARVGSGFFAEAQRITENVTNPEHLDPLYGLMQLKAQGVTLEYVRAMKDAGYPKLQARELLELRNYGIEPSYAKGLHDSGYHDLPPHRIIEFHTYGITPEWLRGIVQSGIVNATSDEIVSIHIHGVDGDFIRKARGRGYTDLSAEELVALSVRGI